MAKYVCASCGKGAGGLLAASNAYVCTNIACAKIWCYDCARGVFKKKCPSCGHPTRKEWGWEKSSSLTET